jgi:DNA-directed RNA polymerase specialized sigma24 family protein
MTMARSRAIDKLRGKAQELSQAETLEAVAETRSENPDPEQSAAVAQQQAQVSKALSPGDYLQKNQASQKSELHTEHGFTPLILSFSL